MTTFGTSGRRVGLTASPAPSPRSAALNATFPGAYLRPNQANAGEVPAGDPMSASPDIWIGGTNAVPNFQTALATASSYATSSPSNVIQNEDNYLYVRAKNGAASAVTRSVKLYYAGCALIPWPGDWVNNVIKTDGGSDSASITNLAAGQVGVADQTFLWPDVPAPPAGSDHYCVFAQLNDANNSNPFPDISSQIDMATLIRNNLAWGWRNVTLVPNTAATWQYQQQLTIPDDLPAQYYNVDVTPTGYVGWNVKFTCSQTDSKGKSMNLESTLIQQDNILLGVSNCFLEPGFNAVVTIYMDSNGKSSSPGAEVPLSCTYNAPPKEVDEVIRRGLVDAARTRLFRAMSDDQIGPTATVPLGAVTYRAVSPSLLGPGS